MFETNPKDLRDLLREAHEGSLQLPDFQRSYVWAEEDVKSLIASVARGFPVGALLTLEAGGSVSFKPRLLEGVEGPSRKPDLLLLDGQQRITSLYGALFSDRPMRTRLRKDQKKTVLRRFYIDLRKALESGEDIEDAIVAVREDGCLREDFKVVLDLSTPEREHEALMFPLAIALDGWKASDWFQGLVQHWMGRDDVSALRDAFRARILKPIEGYKFPVIRLSRDSTREAICLIFEKVNVGGKKLDAFELVTAIYAGQPQPLDLRQDWYGAGAAPGRHRRILCGPTGSGHRNDTLSEVKNTEFLQAVSLIWTRNRRLATERAGERQLPQISCKRETLLGLPLAEYRDKADAVEQGFRRAGQFLNEQYVLWQRDLPYPALVVGLATIFAVLGPKADTVAAKARLSQWFWRVSMAEDFGSATETKLAKDVPELIDWLQGGREPERMTRLGFNPARLDSLRTRLSAAYKAINALLLRSGCRDFVTGDPASLNSFHGNPMDIHHIFPQAWCAARGIPADLYDTVVNKSPLTAASNRSIGGLAPRDYLRQIEQKQGLSESAMDAVLRSHLIEPHFLRNNDFEGFIADRRSRLAGLVQQAMALPLLTGAAPEETSAGDLDDFEDEEAA